MNHRTQNEQQSAAHRQSHIIGKLTINMPVGKFGGNLRQTMQESLICTLRANPALVRQEQVFHPIVIEVNNQTQQYYNAGESRGYAVPECNMQMIFCTGHGVNRTTD